MDQRIIEFVAALRAAGVRISIAESEDAFRATKHIGVRDRRTFRDALRTTLVKEAHHRAVFDKLFPLYFGSGGPPLSDLTQDLAPGEREILSRALRELMQQLQRAAQQAADRYPDAGNRMSAPLDALAQLLQWLLHGTGPTPEQLQQAAEQLGLSSGSDFYRQRQMMREMGMELLEQLMEALASMLSKMGMSQQSIDRLLAGTEANRQALTQQIGQQLGAQAARARAETYPHRRQDVSALMQRAFQGLTEREADLLRGEIRRLAAQLRSRAALRRRRGKRGALDVKRLIRANLRYGGIPLELRFKTRHLKPKLVLICDISTSMRPVVDFLLRIIYELQDQVASARSFAFIDDLSDITPDFAAHRPDVAIESVLTRLPPGHYNTDLGRSLGTLLDHHSAAIDPRTTVIFVGDGRNNYNDPRLDLMEHIQRHVRRLIWLNPEHPSQWGTGDSDMLAYEPYADAVHRVSNLAELASAVDRLLTAR